MEFSQQTCIGEPTEHTHGYKGLKHIIHTQHACPLQMNSDWMISITKLMSDTN